jgi:hypothetical protein
MSDLQKAEELELLRKILAVIESSNAQMKRWFERLHRGDPRICKPEYANPRYYEKFGYEE